MTDCKVFPIVSAVIVIWAISPLFAIGVKTDTERRSLEQVIKSLEAEAERDTLNADLAFRLGRAHALAFALNPDSVDVIRGAPTNKLNGHIRYGSESKALAHEAVLEPNDVRKQEKAAQHLDRALFWYKSALDLGLQWSYVDLGYGWCLEQSGRYAEAKDSYRIVIRKDFDRMRRHKQDRLVMPPDKYTTLTAIDRLRELLDPELDKDELEKLGVETEEVWRWPQYM